MPNYIKIKDNVVADSIMADSLEWCINNLGGEWKEALGSVGIGYTYSKELKAFIPPKPDNAISLDEETLTWIVPQGNYPEES